MRTQFEPTDVELMEEECSVKEETESADCVAALAAEDREEPTQQLQVASIAIIGAEVRHVHAGGVYLGQMLWSSGNTQNAPERNTNNGSNGPGRSRGW